MPPYRYHTVSYQFLPNRKWRLSRNSKPFLNSASRRKLPEGNPRHSTKIKVMSSLNCPRCGAPVSLRRFMNVANKPFCARCGWNLDRAETALAGKSAVVKFLPIAVAAIGLFAFFAASQAHTPAIFFAPALFALIALLPLWGYYSARKAILAAKSTVNPGLASGQPLLDPSLQMLQSLPRPRRVRFRFQGALVGVVFLAATGLAFMAFILASSSRRNVPVSGHNFGFLLPLLFISSVFVLLVVIPFLREKRNLPLLRDGELALGRVVSQQTVQQGKASYSRIDYEFQTNTGQLIRNSSRDVTGTAFEDMTIPVFYDPLNPSKNITPCATYLKIAENPF
jgi:uncharacterized protein (DUF983 family)